MEAIIRKIPVLRELLRQFEYRKFAKAWRKKNKHNETKVGRRLFPIEIVTIGKGTYGTIVIQSLYVTENEKLTIGNYVSIAPNVTFLLGVNHQQHTSTTFPFYSKLIERSPIDAVSKGPIQVDDEVWIGTGAFIFSGIRIGKGAIVGAGAIVTKDVPPYGIVAGNPAKLIRYRFDQEIIDILVPIRFADLSTDWIRKHMSDIYKKIETKEDALHLKKLVESYPR
jgi:virginiamycin A acetyltransferase